MNVNILRQIAKVVIQLKVLPSGQKKCQKKFVPYIDVPSMITNIIIVANVLNFLVKPLENLRIPIYPMNKMKNHLPKE